MPTPQLVVQGALSASAAPLLRLGLSQLSPSSFLGFMGTVHSTKCQWVQPPH